MDENNVCDECGGIRYCKCFEVRRWDESADLRDRFAMAALSAAELTIYENSLDEGAVNECARGAYIWADAMMRAREGK